MAQRYIYSFGDDNNWQNDAGKLKPVPYRSNKALKPLNKKTRNKIKVNQRKELMEQNGWTMKEYRQNRHHKADA